MVKKVFRVNHLDENYHFINFAALCLLLVQLGGWWDEIRIYVKAFFVALTESAIIQQITVFSP